jgi:quercetin 2,3-dioxygenase
MSDSILGTSPLGLHWPTLDPFLFCAHHDDNYPAGNEVLGLNPEQLGGRNIGSDFTLKDGWRMYHGDVVPGFPRHPHRGFETVTLARRGFIDHSDSLGATARFGQGDVQWMTAGRGIVHAEMFPLRQTGAENPVELFQLWMNLPAHDKMVEPHFTMLWAETIPRLHFTDAAGKGVEVVVLAGRFGEAVAPAPPPASWASKPGSGVQIWTITLDAGARFTLPAASAGVNRVIYPFTGSGVTVDGQALKPPVAVQLKPDRAVTLQAGVEAVEILLLEGRPIGEPVAAQGPFVMNTRVELQQAFTDYRNTGFGGWPWDQDDPVHPRPQGRFAIHAGGRKERPA